MVSPISIGFQFAWRCLHLIVKFCLYKERHFRLGLTLGHLKVVNGLDIVFEKVAFKFSLELDIYFAKLVVWLAFYLLEFSHVTFMVPSTGFDHLFFKECHLISCG
mgnify:FL=1